MGLSRPGDSDGTDSLCPWCVVSAAVAVLENIEAREKNHSLAGVGIMGSKAVEGPKHGLAKGGTVVEGVP